MVPYEDGIMVATLTPLQAESNGILKGLPRPTLIPKDLRTTPRQDKVEFGKEPISLSDAQNVVVERALEKLRGVVDAARAELGLPESASFDTSPEATANRIADFALNFFGKYAENNGLADDEAGRAQFADFIGAAISQGIEEARGIFQALNVLNGGVSDHIDKTAGIIAQRLQDFVINGLG